MKKTNLMMLTSIAVGTAAVWAVSSGPVAGLVDFKKAVEKQPIERIVPIGTPSMLPEEGFYTVPFTFAPTQEQFNECEFPMAECNRSYLYDNTEHAFKANYTPNGIYADYWGFLPGIKLIPGVYKFNVDYKTCASYAESFSVSIGAGQTPEAQTIPLCSEEEYINTNYITKEVQFSIDTEGIYYIGMHHTSKPNMFNVYLRNFSLDIVDGTRPATPEITSYDFENGVGSITIAVPSTDIDGTPLASNVTVDVYVDDVAIEGSPFAATAGQTLVVPMTVQKGNREFKVVASAMVGDEMKSSVPFAEVHRITKTITVPVPVPAYFECDQDEFELCTVINANGDANTWKFNENGVANRAAFHYYYSNSKPADDYVVFPPIDCQEAGVYSINFDMATKYDFENLKVYFVADPSLENLREATPVYEIEAKHGDAWKTYKSKAIVSESGQLYPVFYACSPSNRNSIYLSNINIFLDDPRQIGQPAFGDINFDGGDGTVEILLPATTLPGENLPADAVINAILTADGTEAANISGTPGQTIEVPFTDLALGNHTFTLVVNYTVDGITFVSEPISASVKIVPGSSFAYELPFNASLLGTDWDENIIVVDVNEDGKTFTANTDGIKYTYNTAKEADDWVFFLPFNITDVENPVDITLNVKSSPSYEEKFSVWLGTSANIDAMTIEVLPETRIQTGTPTDFTGHVFLPAPGKYYMGVHCTSDKDKLNLYLLNLKAEYGVDDSLFPKPVEGLAVTPDITGALNAEVSFTMPTQTKNGTAMAADEVLTATIVCGESETTVSGVPGSEVSTQITVPQDGQNSITVTVSNAEGVSDPVAATVRCGLDIPVAPAFTYAANNVDGTGVELAWEHVTTGVNGGVVNPELIQYRITPFDEEDNDWDYTQSVYTTENHCVFEGDPEAPQQYVKLGIEAFQNASTNSGIGYINVVMGKPLELDVTEDFAGAKYNAGLMYALSDADSPANPSWYIGDGEYDGLGDLYDPANFMLRGSCYTAGSYSLVLLPMISTEDAGSVDISFEYWSNDNTAHIEGVIGTYGQDREILGAFPEYDEEETPSWKTVTFTLGESYMGRPWVQPGLFVYFAGGTKVKALVNSYSVVKTSQVGTREVIASGLNVAGIRGSILVGGALGQKVVVSDLSGKVIFSESEVAGSMAIPAAKGIYVVRAGEKTFKVTVK